MSQTETPGGDEVDAGEPIEVLGALERPASGGFIARLRRRIERRKLTSEVVSVGWHLPGIILLEFWNMVCQLVLPGEDRKGDTQ